MCLRLHFLTETALQRSGVESQIEQSGHDVCNELASYFCAPDDEMQMKKSKIIPDGWFVKSDGNFELKSSSHTVDEFKRLVDNAKEYINRDIFVIVYDDILSADRDDEVCLLQRYVNGVWECKDTCKNPIFVHHMDQTPYKNVLDDTSGRKYFFHGDITILFKQDGTVKYTSTRRPPVSDLGGVKLLTGWRKQSSTTAALVGGRVPYNESSMSTIFKSVETALGVRDAFADDGTRVDSSVVKPLAKEDKFVGIYVSPVVQRPYEDWDNRLCDQHSLQSDSTWKKTGTARSAGLGANEYLYWQVEVHSDDENEDKEVHEYQPYTIVLREGNLFS